MVAITNSGVTLNFTRIVNCSRVIFVNLLEYSVDLVLCLHFRHQRQVPLQQLFLAQFSVVVGVQRLKCLQQLRLLIFGGQKVHDVFQTRLLQFLMGLKCTQILPGNSSCW